MWYLTGDLHGDVHPFLEQLPFHSDDCIIVLGDSGANFYSNGSKLDVSFKEKLNNWGYTWYMVKGNHDKRPETVESMETKYDENVGGMVYYQEQFPNIRYFRMYGDYTIDGKSILVMGGAYSMDKIFRLENNWPWFDDEQMSKEEMKNCFENYAGQTFDCVLTHTCPFGFIPAEFPYDSRIDYSMEHFFDKIEKNISYNRWYFGHFHRDMDIKSHNATLLYYSLIPLGTKTEEEVKDV